MVVVKNGKKFESGYSTVPRPEGQTATVENGLVL